MAVVLIARSNTGFRLVFRPLANDAVSQAQGQSVLFLQCRNTSGGALGVYTTTTGWPCVEIDWANYNDGDVPPIRLHRQLAAGFGSTAFGLPLGVIEQGMETTADDDLVWVQIQGKHRYVRLVGTGVAGNNNVVVPSLDTDPVQFLMAAISDADDGTLNGRLTRGTTAGQQVFQTAGVGLEARGAGSGVGSVLLLNSCGFQRL